MKPKRKPLENLCTIEHYPSLKKAIVEESVYFRRKFGVPAEFVVVSKKVAWKAREYKFPNVLEIRESPKLDTNEFILGVDLP